MLRRRATPFEKRLGHRFRRPELLERALTHRSHAHEQDLDGHYERLEFLGDAVLGLVVADELFRRFPELPEGELSKLKSHLVSRPVLARQARRLELGGELRLGVGEERSGGRTKASLLADAFEAVLGAVYLDAGLDAASDLILPLLDAGLDGDADGDGRPVDPKTRLQEAVQARGWPLPQYRVVDTTGPDHARRYVVQCRLRGEVAGTGEGRSKKGAQQEAAAAALRSLAAGEAG